MKKITNTNGLTFYYEKIIDCNALLTKGAQVFKISDEENGTEHDLFWVIIPFRKEDWGKEFESPADGHTISISRSKEDAFMVATAMNITMDIHNAAKCLVGKDFEHLKDTYDTDAISNEITRLTKEGKTSDEILRIIMQKKKSFLRNKDDKQNRGEW